MLTAIQHRLNLNAYLFRALIAMVAIFGSCCAPTCAQSTVGPTHLYFFTSDGCAPCEIVKPTIAKLTAGGYPTTTVNVRQRPDWAQHFRVARTPTVILVHNEKMVGRREGMIQHAELVDWFNAVGYSNSQSTAATTLASTPPPSSIRQPVGTKVVLPENPPSTASSSSSPTTADDFRSPTLHQGTNQPANLAEEIAMNATVKLQVEDPEGISYATGTVIHTHGNESLVLTCGHVFRDSSGDGVET